MSLMLGVFSYQRTVLRLFFLLCLLSFPSLSYACAYNSSPDSRSLEAYDVVFAGKLVGCFTDGDVSFTKYSVDRIWKGEVKEFYTSLVTPECRMDWLQELVGKDTLIFGKYVDGSPHVQRPQGLCQPGGPLALTRIQSHLFGFPLPRFFDVQGPPESLDRLGPPIHTFN